MESLNINIILSIILVPIITGCVTFYIQKKIQKDALFVNICERALNIWDLNKNNRTIILNFFEMVSYLVLKKKIYERMAKDIFQPSIEYLFENTYFNGELYKREGTEFEWLMKLAIRWSVINTEKFKKEGNL